jgi:cholesterol oxidase
MPSITRRSLLVGGTGLAAATGLSLVAKNKAFGASLLGMGVRREEHRVVVIGSGFGGGVTALRLARAGVPVLVLERGIRWPTGPNAETFPHALNPLDKRTYWLGSGADPVSQTVGAVSPLLDNIALPGDTRAERASLASALPVGRYTGLLERVAGNGMDIQCAAGVGGGSLIYQGMTLQPSEQVFNATMPEQLDYDRMSRVYYPRVARMLNIALAPDELISNRNYHASRVFADHVQRAGYRVEKIPMPIDWNFALRELAGEMKPSYTNGDCAYGVNNGGKHSVDVTYLAHAEATGRVTVAVLHHVTDVARAGDGRWEVHVDRIATDGTVLEKKIITTKALVMAAGSANTTKLLMRAAEHGTVPDLPDGLGTNWGTNGDRICYWTSLAEDFGAPQGGPVVFGSKDWDHPETANTIIQAALPPLPDLRTTVIVGYGVSTGRGRFVWDPVRGEAVLHWPADGDAKLTQRIHARMDRITAPLAGVIDSTSLSPSTWHPVGGASMGTVCDLAGRVKSQCGLYVLDGALLPGTSAACNPSMTIAALAERATDELITHDVDTVF